MMLTEVQPQQLQQQILMATSQPEVQRLFQNVPQVLLPNFTSVYQSPTPQQQIIESTGGGCRKRRKASGEYRSPVQQQTKNSNNNHQLVVDLNQSFAQLPPVGGVSTGLRLAFDDERSSVTSSSTPTVSLRDEISAQIAQQQEELNQILNTQAEQFRQAIEQRTHRHSKALLSVIENDMRRRIRDKEAELERLKRRNMELEETVRQITIESQMWQSKAKNSEAMVAMLRTSLQQAVMVHQQSRDHHQNQNPNSQHQQAQSKLIEGCGESEADDAASAYVDENIEAQQTRAMMMKGNNSAGQGQGLHSHASCTSSCLLDSVRVCRRCRASEACVVLLPCYHLCLCTSCKDLADRCPICNSLKSTAVEVFLS